MPEYELRVVGSMGPMARAACPGFSSGRSVVLHGFADGPEGLLRALKTLVDRHLPVELNVIGLQDAAEFAAERLDTEATCQATGPQDGPCASREGDEHDDREHRGRRTHES